MGRGLLPGALVARRVGQRDVRDFLRPVGVLPLVCGHPPRLPTPGEDRRDPPLALLPLLRHDDPDDGGHRPRHPLLGVRDHGEGHVRRPPRARRVSADRVTSPVVSPTSIYFTLSPQSHLWGIIERKHYFL